MSVAHGTDIDNTDLNDPVGARGGKPDKLVTVDIDESRVRTRKDTTAGALLVLAGLDPARRRLVKVRGKHQTPYPDPDTKIEVHEGDHFVTVSTGSTPVS